MFAFQAIGMEWLFPSAKHLLGAFKARLPSRPLQSVPGRLVPPSAGLWGLCLSSELVMGAQGGVSGALD